MPGAVRKPPNLPKPGHLPGVEHNVTDGVRLPAPAFRPLRRTLKVDPDLAAVQVRAPAPGTAAFPPFPAVHSRSVGARRRRFPAHRLGQPGRLRLRVSRQFPGSLIPACRSRPGSVRSASRLSRSASWSSLPSSRAARAARRAAISASACRRARFSEINAASPEPAGHPHPERPFHRHPVNRRPTCPPTRKPKAVSGHAATVVFCLLFPFLVTVNGPVKHTCQGGCFKNARTPRSCPYYEKTRSARRIFAESAGSGMVAGVGLKNVI